MHIERHLTAADDRGFELLDALLDGPFAVCRIVTDDAGRSVDYRFLRISRCFEESTGFQGIEGRTIREILPEVEPAAIERYGLVALERRPARFRESLAATGRDYEVRVAPLDPPGHFVLAFEDVTSLRRIAAEREAALGQAQHLLRELGHRVMNSFAAISAIIAMETRATPAEGRPPLERVQGRVQALAALYRRLDGAPQSDRIEVSDHLGGLVAAFRDSLAAAAGATVTAELAPLMMPARAAVPLALVANELLTGAVGRAGEAAPGGQVRVSLGALDGFGRLAISSERPGGSDGAAGIGPGLVAAFVGELGGEIDTITGPRGTTVTVTFPV